MLLKMWIQSLLKSRPITHLRIQIEMLRQLDSLQMELAQITTTCATRVTVNLTYSCNNFLVSYQSVLDKFFRTSTPLVTLSTLTLTELEKKVDVMLANCNTIECYNKVGLFNTHINQLFIDKAEDLLKITGQQVLMDKFAPA